MAKTSLIKRGCMSYLMYPINTESVIFDSYPEIKISRSGRKVLEFSGYIEEKEREYCPYCGGKMHKHGIREVKLLHLPQGDTLVSLRIEKVRYRCVNCKRTKTQEVDCKAENHNITVQLYDYVTSLLKRNQTNREVSNVTGIDENIIKAIDMARLQAIYTVNGVTLKKPDEQAIILGIDEFKLHDGNIFGTHITNLMTGHILWIGKGKKKQIVYDFIDHVGLEYMSKVEAISCDMNSDFYEAFKEKCPHLEIVFDHFHIVKNFNDKVISAVRKDEQKRLLSENKVEEAKSLKGAKHILTAKKSTLKKKDEKAKSNVVIRKGSELFKTPEVTLKEGYVEKYESLLAENKLFLACDIIKEKLDKAYKTADSDEMTSEIKEIMEICEGTGNSRFKKFASMLNSHLTGIVSHAKYAVSNGKIEGINNKIKTLRRAGYGYPDDEYFFLKLIDASYREYNRNLKSHHKLE
jgi:transposase